MELVRGALTGAAAAIGCLATAADQVVAAAAGLPRCSDSIVSADQAGLTLRRLYRGIWLDILDGSGCFLEGRTDIPDPAPDADCRMLEGSSGGPPPLPSVSNDAPDYRIDSRVSLVEFEGRQTAAPMAAPPVGGSLVFGTDICRYVIVVDRAVRFEALRETPQTR